MNSAGQKRRSKGPQKLATISRKLVVSTKLGQSHHYKSLSVSKKNYSKI